MDVSKIIERVQKTVQDVSFTDDDILDYINEGIMTVAGLIALPALEKTDTVITATDKDYKALPDDFHGHLRHVYSTARRVQVEIHSNLVRLREKVSRRTSGFVFGVAVSAGNLFYTPTPLMAETLEIIYHTLPDPLEDTMDEPDYLPPHVGPILLHAYACQCIFDLIEDGVDGNKINTAHWEGKYQAALGELLLFVGPLYTKPIEIFDEMGF